MTLNVNVGLSLTGRYQSAAGLSAGESKTADLNVQAALALVSGTGVGFADLIYAGTRTIAASGSENLDLAGSLTDEFGATLNFAKIKGILVRAAAGNTNNVVVGGAASNTFQGPFGAATHTIAIAPGDFAFLGCSTGAGWPVTATTADLLKVANSGGTTGVTYDIVIIGASA